MRRVTTNPARAPLALIVALATLAVAAASADAVTVSEPVEQSPAAVREYWTMARMLSAEAAQPPTPEVPAPAVGGSYDPAEATYVPAGGAPAAMRSGSPAVAARGTGSVDRREVSDPAAAEVRMHGKVFFTVTVGGVSTDRVCSGTAVNSRNRSVVWTAGHCVFEPDGGKAYATNWVFVPAFSAAGAPFGEWPAKLLATTSGWMNTTSFRDDLGAAVVTKDQQGRRLQRVVGARGIGFDQPRNQRYSAYGYPAVGNPDEFTGDREYRCVGGSVGADAPLGSGPATIAIDCDMLGGASGGGWIARGTLMSVTSYGYTFEPDRLYGPYLSKTAKALYRSVARRRKKKGRGGRARRHRREATARS